MNAAIDQAMTNAITTGIFPAGDLLVVRAGEIIFHHHYGDAREGTTFDISSLTKPIATSTLVMMLAGEGKLSLDDTLSDWFDRGMRSEHESISIEMLMNHRSGLPKWRPLYRQLPSALIGTDEGKAFIIDACLDEPLENEPGTITLYSDLNYILLGSIVERSGGNTLDRLFSEKIADPLEMMDSFFVSNAGDDLRTTARRTDTSPDQHVPTRGAHRNTIASRHKRFAATEDCPWRGRVIHGQVHDQNAYAMGGIAGHAGLFSTAKDIHLFIKRFMANFKDYAFIARKVIERVFPLKAGLISPQEPGTYVGGWDTPFERNSAAGNYSSRHAIGHLGYTGCSMWIDQEQDFWIILLTNRIHPSTTNERIKAFRPHIHDLIYRTLLSQETACF